MMTFLKETCVSLSTLQVKTGISFVVIMPMHIDNSEEFMMRMKMETMWMI